MVPIIINSGSVTVVTKIQIIKNTKKYIILLLIGQISQFCSKKTVL